MKKMHVLSSTGVEKRMNAMDSRAKANLLAVLLKIQDAMGSISADGREIVLSMWLEQALGSDVMAKIIESEEE